MRIPQNHRLNQEVQKRADTAATWQASCGSPYFWLRPLGVTRKPIARQKTRLKTWTLIWQLPNNQSIKAPPFIEKALSIIFTFLGVRGLKVFIWKN
jgi:hypothetical protein